METSAPIKVTPGSNYSSSPHSKRIYKEIEQLRSKSVRNEPMDEALGGKTLKGTRITARTPECFPAEPRDLFWQMDMVAGNDGKLHPLNFDVNGDGKIDDKERNAIRGRNTWILWAGGNEGFWNWLAQDGYGITDFLALLDSRARTSRFQRAGLMNQPGFIANNDPSRRILGLYLDAPAAANLGNSDLPEGFRSYGHVMDSPAWDSGIHPKAAPVTHGGYELFEPGDRALYEDVLAKLDAMGDGVDYTIYGYPSGVVGLRLFPNPDFFGKGSVPDKARRYWTERVENTHDRYYSDTSITKDPQLIRPFRVGMSCGFCHVGPHPLNPPSDPERPDWANLSSTIGNQFWKPQPAFANLQSPNSFLHHFIASQQPGTVDTSLVSSDQINNANTINAVFDINARLSRASLNPPERQSIANVLVKSIEDPDTIIHHNNQDLRHTPRVLLDGSDSIGAFGALARVYLNIGTFYEEWLTCHNAIIGLKRQRPFSLEVCQKNSVYWKVNEQYRTDYLAAFFTLKYGRTGAYSANRDVTEPSADPHTSTDPMKLATAKESDGATPNKVAQSFLKLDSAEQRQHGRELWLNNCAICHSSKQPKGFEAAFVRKPSESWKLEAAPEDNRFTLPMDAGAWGAFKQSPAFEAYISRLKKVVETAGPLSGDPISDKHGFWKDNYLSTDIRIPLTLVGTPSGRALASNGIEHNVWDNFTSLTYKDLPPVGSVSFFNPISKKEESFEAPGGGRGYYRPATHISLWATAPYLHNNGLGVYLHDPSMKGRLIQFSDGIRRMLWKEKRSDPNVVLSKKELKWLESLSDNAVTVTGIAVKRPGDLRQDSSAASHDPGFIYRLPQDTMVEFPAAYTHALVAGILGKALTAILSIWIWPLLIVWFVFLSVEHKPRYLGITLIAFAVVFAAVIALSGLTGSGSTAGVLVMGASGLLELSSLKWWLIVAALAAAGIVFIQAKPESRSTAQWLLGALLIGTIILVAMLSRSLWLAVLAVLIGLAIWKWWKPTLPGFSRAFFLTLAILTAVGGYVTNRFIYGRPLIHIPLANITIGPLNVRTGPIPRGTPVNLVMNLDPESSKTPKALVSLILAMAEIKKHGFVGETAWGVLEQRAGQALMDASKCPDFVLDRGHLFGETLDPDREKNDQSKEDLIAFLKTL